jgi:hypothetical protein
MLTLCQNVFLLIWVQKSFKNQYWRKNHLGAPSVRSRLSGQFTWRSIREFTLNRKPFSFSQCAKSVALKADLQKQLGIHTNEKSYSCFHCKKSCSVIFKRHIIRKRLPFHLMCRDTSEFTFWRDPTAAPSVLVQSQLPRLMNCWNISEFTQWKTPLLFLLFEVVCTISWIAEAHTIVLTGEKIFPFSQCTM